MTRARKIAEAEVTLDDVQGHAVAWTISFSNEELETYGEPNPNQEADEILQDLATIAAAIRARETGKQLEVIQFKAYRALVNICQEIAGDKNIDLLTSERRIRLYHALHLAGELNDTVSHKHPTPPPYDDVYYEAIRTMEED